MNKHIFKVLLLILSPILILSAEGNGKMDNPFFKKYSTPHQTPPFNEIKFEHYQPAFEEGIKQHKVEVDKIINNTEAPTFDNTITALEISGELLNKVSSVFFNLTSSNTNDAMQKLSSEMAPKLAKHGDEISLDLRLFERIKKIYNQKDKLNLTVEQKTLLEKYYKDFVRSGAELNDEQKAKLMKINEELSVLTIKVGQNILKETNNFELVIENEKDLAGLPESLIKSAAETAKRKGKEGKWVFTLHAPSIFPFLTYAENRELRKQILTAYANRGNNNNEFDNKKALSKIASLRNQKANLLGYKTHADYVLENSMAKSPDKVFEFLDKLWTPALRMAKEETAELQQMINKEGNNFKLEAWDWRYYAEKLKKEKYSFDDEMLRPYFKLENVIQGVFDVSSKLFGLKFEKRNDIQTYHPEVTVFEVKEADGKHIGILYTDYFPRESKRGGAWMNAFRKQQKAKGENVTPIICNVGNFSKPTEGQPALISFEEVNTLFHEFGHALHGLLSNSVYPSVSGTSVPRDFVELPSQIMENWASDPEVLKMYAKHYQTGEVMPDELIEKIQASSKYGQGFASTEYLAASYLDMYWHSLTTDEEQDALSFEDNVAKKIGLIPEILFRYRSTYFNHIFSGGYSAGYYSYIWAEVLDADAFAAFKEKDIFDKATAKSYRDNILAKGGSEDPMVLYKRFRGAEPSVEPLLKKRGLE
ncbi:MAG: M3 family metallopeptidase [Ignavibacteriaceae bacterium]|nr:M3 family metallopeptidase [Ignavibacteriaceae bacterium]